MSGGRRLAMAIWAAGLVFGSAAAFAQSADPQTNNPPPAADAVGPRDLQNFSLSGTVTKPADEPAARPSAPVTSVTQPTSAQATTVRSAAPPVHSAPRAKAAQVAAVQATPVVASTPSIAPPAPHNTLQSPAVGPVSLPSSSPTPAALPPAAPAAPITDSRQLLWWPWFLALCVLAAGLALLFWRSRQRHAFAGGLEFEPYTAPEPPPKAPPAPRAPAPAEPPRPKLPPAAPPVPPKLDVGSGVVASRLRPWVELGIQPLRCVLEDQQVTVEFELELFNSGNAPARAVLVEASIFNAGPAQDEEIGAFIAHPVGAGERLDAIAPLQRVSLRTQVVAPRTSVQAFEVAGRQLFVPLIAFNTLYHWSGGEGQTSVSYLLGRDTKADKLAPFRLDLGPRVFRGLGARPLPLGERR